MNEFPRDKMAIILRWLDELSVDSRLMIIISASRIDDLLKGLLQKVMVHQPGSSDSLFESDRPLGSFSARIALAYRLGLVDREFESFLQAIRRLRNDAAHSSEHIDLSKSPHVDRVNHLQALASNAPMWSIFSKEQFIPKNDPHRSLCASIILGVLSLEVAMLTAKQLNPAQNCGFHLVRMIPEENEPTN